MRPYARQCGGTVDKISTQDHAGRAGYGVPGLNPQGAVIADKTQHCQARPGAKEKLRNAKRAFKKRARQKLKRDMEVEVA